MPREAVLRASAVEYGRKVIVRAPVCSTLIARTMTPRSPIAPERYIDLGVEPTVMSPSGMGAVGTTGMRISLQGFETRLRETRTP
jgi:hypothetical protein